MMRRPRRTTSHRAQTFVRLRRYCREHDVPLACFLDDLADRYLDAVGTPPVSPEEAAAELDGEPTSGRRTSTKKAYEQLERFLEAMRP